MVGVGDPDDAFGFRGDDEVAFEDAAGGELVVVAGDEEFGDLAAAAEEIVAVVAAGGLDGEAYADEAGEAWVAAGGAKADVGAEAEAGEEERFVGEVGGEPVEGGFDVVDFALAVVVGAFGEACAAEVEAEDGEAEVGEGFGGVVDDLVVHSAAAEGVRVGDEGGEGGVVFAGVEEGFEAACGAVEVFYGLDG